MAKLVFGCGYVGMRVARAWCAGGETVYAVTRTADRAAELQSQGIRTIVADILGSRELAVALQSITDPLSTILFAVGNDRVSGLSIEEVYPTAMASVLAALPVAPARFIYISSTGVYGDSDGDWVDEDSVCRPRRAGGVASLTAEARLLAHPIGQAAGVVLRLAGVYGPGRIPRRAAMLAGEPIPAPSDGYLNLIHVDDIVQAVLAAEQHARAPRRYCIADGHPGQRRDYYTELARLLGAPAPRFVEPPPDSPAAARASADKRISNRRMLDELHVKLCYPSFREGLAAIVKEE